MPERMRFSRGRHIHQTYEGRECRGDGSAWGCILLMDRVNLRDTPPPRARHTLTTRKPHAHAAPKHDASSVWSPRPRTNLTPLTHILLLSLRFCADARVHPPPHRPACAPPRLHQRPVAAGSSCLHLSSGVYQILPRSITTRRASRDNLRFNSREATTDISQVRLRPPFGDGGGAESGCGCRF